MVRLAPSSEPRRTAPLAALLAQLAQARGERGPALPFGIAPLDERLADGGLDGAALHEVAAACPTLNDDAASTLFIAGIAARFASKQDFTVVWAVTKFDLYALGLEQVGLSPDKLLYAQGTNDSSVLAMAEDRYKRLVRLAKLCIKCPSPPEACLRSLM